MSASLASQPTERDRPASYDRDVYAWAAEQARLLRERRFDLVDVANVAEEIESVGRSERSALTSYLARIMQHMLKWDHQPEKRSASWATSIRVHRIHAERTLRHNPALRSRIEEVLDDSYRLAVAYAAEEIGLAETELPRTRPYDFGAVLESDAYSWP